MNGTLVRERTLRAMAHVADAAVNASLTSVFDSAIAIALGASIGSGCGGEARSRGQVTQATTAFSTNERPRKDRVGVRNPRADAGNGLR